MGQIALGIRSLLIKGTIFFLLAALLAWALGGTLFPRDSRVDYPPVTFADTEWHVRLRVGGDRPGVARYQLMRRNGRAPEPVGGEFTESSSIVVGADTLLVAMRHSDAEGGAWLLRRFTIDGAETGTTLPDRLAVESALAAARPSGGALPEVRVDTPDE